ncbi:MAG: tRNA (adenosine(37)-N6)-dimethylallyltransferase MiaA [Chitinophagales bacterium]|nr:tRNA (adenosine(37)-N6)-dimethylallyltransferase MiaA [Chitinophagaceae bacterium]MCB9063882.1 tRNA (adenosine(37)-N6)-dimethylallyltransferase MiaA [Chitinophagales bacterium]
MNSDKTVYVIAGPTAVGKTAIAIALAKKLDTEIISADSRQCYREMSIGTAKPTKEELTQVHHYFINSHSVTEELNAADYEKLALTYLEEIFKQHDTAVVCGGTGLYIKALCEGIDEMPEVDNTVEEEIQAQFKEQGIEWLQNAVKEEDPSFYETGEIQNPVRLIRALTFVRSTGESITAYRTGQKKERPFNVVKIALEMPREVLYDRINRRVDLMMQEGLLEEAKTLYTQKGLKNLQTVGYQELFEYMDGKCTLEDAVDKIKQHSRNYAKRQLTWFRKDKEYRWLDASSDIIVKEIINNK